MPHILLSFCLLLLHVITVAWGNDSVKGVSFGSVLKLEHVSSGYRLHSHSLPYGQGSGQQSVTGMEQHGDSNSLWILKEPYSERDEHVEVPAGPRTGVSVKCGGKVRLQHLNTGKNLHSHMHPAPMNRHEYEVSAYARESEDVWRDGDSGDDWEIQCEGTRNGNPWMRDTRVWLRHVDTGTYLSASERLKYSQPIEGQLHVSGRRFSNSDCLWRAAEGFFVATKES